MSLDAVVAQVGAALGRGHALFSPAPTDAGASLRASADTFDAVSRKMTDTSTQMLDTKGRFGAAYGDMAQRFSSRFAASGGQDRTIAGLASEAADADGAGRTQTGNVVNGAVSDTNRNAPYSNTVAGQNALLTDLRDRVDQQRKVIAAYKNLVGQLAARARAQGGRGGRGMGAGSGLGQMFGGLGGGQSRGGGGSGGGGLGGFSPASLTGLLKPALDTNSRSGPSIDSGAGVGGPATFGDYKERQMQVAKAIVGEGLRRGISPFGIQIALATALAESGMRSLANKAVPDSLLIPNDGIGSDHDSVGPFQQRQSWGRTADLMNPSTSAGKFYDELVKVRGWQNMALTQAAQAVQRSAFPDAYAKQAGNARALLNVILGH
ncbi:hypothetical protein [Mycobacteroides chelonae]|uniref:hypothetical protein n=1 Tax=Mycobacteroides chelonae TaxID=1774 RepID=UPI0008A87AD1|nr:hypothetical protein [Mycobacteroides chelonae]OHT73371.1 hypothetical protein BKG66_07945 [Mycobacteroides chelonae]